MTYKVTWHPFDKHPRSDSCWSLSAGPDGRIYAAACLENAPAGDVQLFRYNDETDRLDHILDVPAAIDDPADSGRASQCKIHYSFVPSMADGILYVATHTSAPGARERFFSAFRSWHDPKVAYRGSALIAYDVAKDQVLWWETLLPREGCRCLLHDEERGLLYALSYPRDHLFCYDLHGRKLTDLGRIGSVNAQVLLLDARHRVWTSSDDGRLMRYDPEVGRIEITPIVLPHERRYQTGWHSVLYDAVQDPAGPCVYASTWIARPHLFRFWPDDGEWGRLEDLGPATQERDTTIPFDTFIDHCGGLTFADDGCLYYVAARWRDPCAEFNAEARDGRRDREGVLWRLDPSTLERQEVAVLERPDAFSQYVSRGAIDRNGDLFFAHVPGDQPPPAGIFRVLFPADGKRSDAERPTRIWG
jgi:hypothetical protein